MCARRASVAGSMRPIHARSQSRRGAKSQTSRGTNQPRRAAATTTARPKAPPINDGNSGPSSTAQARYGTVKANAEKSAKGHAAKPSRALRRAP